MLDNALITLIKQVLTAGEASRNIAGTPIAQAFQPTQQGVNTAPTIFIYKVGDRRYGWVGRDDIYNEDTEQFDHVETQQYETTFQISAQSTADPANQGQLTASDICNLCASILQSSDSIQLLQAQNVGVERVTDVRNPYFMDDRENFAEDPSFDIVVTHKQIITVSNPIIDDVIVAIYDI